MHNSVNSTTSITFFAFLDDFDKQLKRISIDGINPEYVLDGHGMIHGWTVDLLWVDEPGSGAVKHFNKIFAELGKSDVLSDFELYLLLVLRAEEFEVDGVVGWEGHLRLLFLLYFY